MKTDKAVEKLYREREALSGLRLHLKGSSIDLMRCLVKAETPFAYVPFRSERVPLPGPSRVAVSFTTANLPDPGTLELLQRRQDVRLDRGDGYSLFGYGYFNTTWSVGMPSMETGSTTIEMEVVEPVYLPTPSEGCEWDARGPKKP